MHRTPDVEETVAGFENFVRLAARMEYQHTFEHITRLISGMSVIANSPPQVSRCNAGLGPSKSRCRRPQLLRCGRIDAWAPFEFCQNAALQLHIVAHRKHSVVKLTRPRGAVATRGYEHIDL